MQPLIYDQSYEEIIITYFRYYGKEFGERKAISVAEKIKSSNKVAQLIIEADLKRTFPNHLDILTCINTIPYFIFSSGQTQALGALMALESWKTNTRNDLADEYILKNIAINIIKDSAPTFHEPSRNSLTDFNKNMQLSDKYPTDDYFNLFRKIEGNIKVLIDAFNRTAAKDNNALTKNIHYTVLLPILKQFRQSETFIQSSLTPPGKKLLSRIVDDPTPVFCIGALMVHSMQLSMIISAGFKTLAEVQKLLHFATEAVLKANPHSKCNTESTIWDPSSIRYFTTEIPKRQKLNTLFENC